MTSAFEREFEGIERFERISRSHPSQLAILHVGKNEAAGCFCYVMELADAVENPKSGYEHRKKSEAQNPSVAARARNLGLRVSVFLRNSVFDLRISTRLTPSGTIWSYAAVFLSRVR